MKVLCFYGYIIIAYYKVSPKIWLRSLPTNITRIILLSVLSISIYRLQHNRPSGHPIPCGKIYFRRRTRRAASRVISWSCVHADDSALPACAREQTHTQNNEQFSLTFRSPWRRTHGCCPDLANQRPAGTVPARPAVCCLAPPWSFYVMLVQPFEPCWIKPTFMLVGKT